MKLGKRLRTAIIHTAVIVPLTLVAYRACDRYAEQEKAQSAYVQYDTRIHDNIRRARADRTINQEALAERIREIGSSTLSPSGKEAEYNELKDTFGEAAMVDAFASIGGIDAANPEELGAYLNEMQAYATQAQVFSSTSSLGVFFIQRFAYHYDQLSGAAEARYEQKMQEREAWDPYVKQFKWQTGRYPTSEEIQKHERLGGADAIWETRTPWNTDANVVGREKYEGQYGGWQRDHIVIGSPSDVDAGREAFAARARQEAKEQQRQESYEAFRNDPVGRRVAPAADAARRYGGQAVDHGKKIIGDILKGQQKKPDNR